MIRKIEKKTERKIERSPEILRQRNLTDRLTCWTLQAGVGFFTFNQGFRMSSDYFNTIYYTKNEIVNNVGNIGYVTLQLVAPALMFGVAGILTYISTRGTGMFVDKLLYKDISKSSQPH